MSGISGPSTVLTGGVWSVALAQQEALAEVGGELHLLSGWADRTAPARAAGQTVVPLRGVPFSAAVRWLWSVSFVRAARRLASRSDVVHLHLCRDFLTTFVLWVLPRSVTTVAQPHGMLRRQRAADAIFDRVLLQPVLSKVDAWLCLTDDEVRDLAALSVPSEKIHRIHNSTAAPGRTWTGEARDTVAFVSRLHPRKRPDVALEAVGKLAAAGRQVRLVLAGPDQGMREDLLRRAAELGLADRVELLGSVDAERVADLLVRSRCLVLPSVVEPYPMIILEAAAVGTPVVVSDQTGVSELLEQRGAACVVPPEAEEVAAALGRVLDDDVLAGALSREVRRVHAEHWALGGLGRRLVDVYGATRQHRPAVSRLQEEAS